MSREQEYVVRSKRTFAHTSYWTSDTLKGWVLKVIFQLHALSVCTGYTVTSTVKVNQTHHECACRKYITRARTLLPLITVANAGWSLVKVQLLISGPRGDLFTKQTELGILYNSGSTKPLSQSRQPEADRQPHRKDYFVSQLAGCN